MICGTCDRANGICRFVSQDRAISKIAAVREAVGSEVGIGVDFHGRVHKTMPKILAKELEPFIQCLLKSRVAPKQRNASGNIQIRFDTYCYGRKDVFEMAV